MRVAVTGTPGTGKTTVVDYVETNLDVVHLNDLVREEGLTAGRDEDRDTLVADLDGVRQRLSGADDVIVESHLAHHLDADRVAVLRCRPDELRERLAGRGEADPKIDENAQSEALDVVLAEAVQRHGPDAVYEIDTTGRAPGAVAADLEGVVESDREPSQGIVDFSDALEP